MADLAGVRAEFEAGRLSYSQVRALTRVASGENEEELLELARHATAVQLKRIVRGYRAPSTLADDARRAREARPGRAG